MRFAPSTLSAPTEKNIVPIVRANIAKESRLATDEGRHYVKVGGEFAEHLTVHHAAEEYVRGDASTNTVEGYFSIFNRGMTGVYQHCGESICTAISPSLISAITIAPHLA